MEVFTNCVFLKIETIIRLPHSVMETYLKYFSFFPDTEIESILQKGLKKHSFYAHERLAESLTLLVHGGLCCLHLLKFHSIDTVFRLIPESGLNQAINATKGLLNNEVEALANLTEEDIYYIFGENIIKLAEFDPEGTTVLDLVNKTKCFADTSKLSSPSLENSGTPDIFFTFESALAIPMIEKGAVYINGRKFTNPLQLVGPESVLQNNLTIVKIGMSIESSLWDSILISDYFNNRFLNRK